MGLHLARALLYLPANGLQRRRDVLRLGVVALGRPLLHLQLDRAFSEGEMHHHLTAALTAVRYRKVLGPCDLLRVAFGDRHRKSPKGIGGTTNRRGMLRGVND
jgi:hypothetical protein